jgi:lysophospholipase L1-like esterase
LGVIHKIEVFGDSILKGIQLNKQEQKYVLENHIDIPRLSSLFSLEINNRSKFGFTVTKCASLIGNFLKRSPECSAVVMDLGGNDCNFNWAEIAESPEGEHEAITPLPVFENTYRDIIHTLKDKNIKPILTTLPPLDPQRFFDWFFRDLNKVNLLKWLGGVTAIYRFQEKYSRAVERIAVRESVPIVDLRGAFLSHDRIEHLLCEDGIHPTTAGQAVITEAFVDFAKEYLAA